MTKGSSRRRARAESGRQLETAARALKAGKAAEALSSLAAAARLAPDDPEVLGHLGWAFVLTGRVRQAVDVLRRSVTLRPDAGDVHHHLGVALQALGDERSAIAEFQEAVRLSPELADANQRLGDLLLQKGLRAEAAAAYEAAAAVAPGSPAGRFQSVMAALAVDRLEEAEAGLRQIVASEPANGRALQLLGLVQQLNGRLAEAEATFERAILADPANAHAYHGLVHTRKLGEADRPWVARILARIESTDWHKRFAPIDVDRQRMTLHFAAAKVLDDLADHAEAMRHFDAANQIRRRLGPYDREGLEKRVDGLVSRYSADFLAGCRSVGDEEERTPILIVGLPRSGTSLLERIVSSHPSVRAAGELDFWNGRGPRFSSAEPAALAAAAPGLRADYLRALRGGEAGFTRATDKMPFNFFWLGLVHLLFPNAVILHCRRNPADTCLSIYMTHFTVVLDFASSLADLAHYYRQYARLMDHWRSVIPADRLIDVGYEEVVTDTEKVARDVLSRCGLPWDPACLHPERNTRALATASHWQARQPIYRTSVERWRRYEPWIGELRALVCASPASAPGPPGPGRAGATCRSPCRPARWRRPPWPARRTRSQTEPPRAPAAARSRSARASPKRSRSRAGRRPGRSAAGARRRGR